MDADVPGNSSAQPIDPAALAASGADGREARVGCDFGLETRECDLEDRDFAFGDKVRIDKRAFAIDDYRLEEGLPLELRGDCTPGQERMAPEHMRLREEVTGAKGTVTNGAYWSEDKQDEMVPIETNRGAVLYVPSKKLERAEAPARTGRTTYAMTKPLAPDEKILLAKYTEYKQRALVAQLDRVPFPTFTEWLASPKNAPKQETPDASVA